MEKESCKEEPRAGDDAYEPPAVEEVLSADDLAREIHYAGSPISGGGGG